MEIKIENLKPFVTLLLFRSENSSLIVNEVISKMEEISKTLNNKTVVNHKTGKIVNELNPFNKSNFFAKAAWYTLESSPSWFGADNETSFNAEEFPEITDIHNHLVILGSYNGHLVCYASQEIMRNRLKELISNGYIGVEIKKEKNINVKISHLGELIGRKEIEVSFVKGEAKNAWLEGLHAPTVLKADRKILSGPNLRYALDSFGDQTYTYSAAISEFDEGGKYRIGISHTKNTIWRGQTKSFDNFVNESKRIIHILSNTKETDEDELLRSGLPYLARPMDSSRLSELEDGFELTYENPIDSEKELLVGGVVEKEIEFDNWQKNGYFQVIQKVTKRSKAEIVADAYYENDKIACISILPVSWGDQRIELKVRILDYYVPHKDDWRLVGLDNSLIRRNKRLTLRYGSGHIIQGGMLYTLQFRDTIYDNWNWIEKSQFETPLKFNLNKEKPEKPSGKKDKNGREIFVFDSDKIGKSDSLFCFTVKNTKMVVKNKHLSNLSDDYLILCDDGGGELADFIVIDPNPMNKYIIFIHIKAAKKISSEISLDKIPELISMALKNLNSLDQGILIENLKTRTTDNKKYWVWDSKGNLSDRDNFISTLENMKRGAAKHIVIFQPLIERTIWEKNVTNHRNEKIDTNVGRMRQLSSLLSSTEESAKRLSATMSVIGIYNSKQ